MAVTRMATYIYFLVIIILLLTINVNKFMNALWRVKGMMM